MATDLFSDPSIQSQATAAGHGSVEVHLQTLVDRDRERLAVAEGIEAMKSGQVRPFEEFDREFRSKHNLAPRQ